MDRDGDRAGDQALQVADVGGHWDGQLGSFLGYSFWGTVCGVQPQHQSQKLEVLEVPASSWEINPHQLQPIHEGQAEPSWHRQVNSETY